MVGDSCLCAIVIHVIQLAKSHIQWSKTTKILGGGLADDDDDKVTSALVSLFSRSGNAIRK